MKTSKTIIVLVAITVLLLSQKTIASEIEESILGSFDEQATLKDSNKHDIKNFGAIAFMSDFHFNPHYEKDILKLQSKKSRPNYIKMRRSLMKMSGKSRRTIYSFVLHVHEQVKKLSQVYKTASPTINTNETSLQMKDDLVQKMIDQTNLIMRQHKMHPRMWSDAAELTKFIKEHIITNNYKITPQQATHFCMLGNMLSSVVNGGGGNKGSDIFNGCHHDMGHYGLDSPKSLIKEFMDNLAKNYYSNDTLAASKLQGIILDGDFPTHHSDLSKKGTPQEEKDTFNNIASMINHTLNEIRVRMPGVPILPALGNNDLFYHNQVPCANTEQSEWFYRDLFELWFPEGPQFASNPQARNKMKESFLKGGYYAFDFPDSDLTLITLNTLQFIHKNKCKNKGAMEQLEWFEQVFEEYEAKSKKSGGNPRQFILSMHEFHGLNYFEGKFQKFWLEEFGQKYLEILNKNQQNIKLVSSAHIHRTEMRSQFETQFPDINIPQLVLSSISPVYTNNPGYTVIEASSVVSNSDGTRQTFFSQHRQHNFQLQYYMVTGDVQSSWRIETPKRAFGLDINNGTTLRQYNQQIRSAEDFGAFLSFEFGFDSYLQHTLFKQFIMPFYMKYYDSNFMSHDMCAMMFFESEQNAHFQDCIKKYDSKFYF